MGNDIYIYKIYDVFRCYSEINTAISNLLDLILFNLNILNTSNYKCFDFNEYKIYCINESHNLSEVYIFSFDDNKFINILNNCTIELNNNNKYTILKNIKKLIVIK